MADIRVVNSSPLITLAKVRQLSLLMGYGRQLLIPEQVAGEVMAGLEDDPARLALEGGFGAPFYPVSIDPESLVGVWAPGNRRFYLPPGRWAPLPFLMTAKPGRPLAHSASV